MNRSTLSRLNEVMDETWALRFVLVWLLGSFVAVLIAGLGDPHSMPGWGWVLLWIEGLVALVLWAWYIWLIRWVMKQRRSTDVNRPKAS